MSGAFILTLVAIGLTSGIVMSLIGASAVMIIVPSLTMLLGYQMHMAIAVSLLVDVLASLAVGFSYWRHGNVDLFQGIWIAMGSIAGAQLGAGYIVVLPEWFLTISYGLWMVGAGITIWKKGLDRAAITNRFAKYVNFDSNRKRIAVALILGFIIGVNCGIFGAGGGVLILMVLMFVLDYPVHKAVGTSTVMMAITAASATAGYMLRGFLDIQASLIMVVGTIAGGVAGARFANKSSERLLSRVIGGLFVALGVIMTGLRLI